MTLVAKSVTKNIEGSVTICNDVYPTGAAPIVEVARGIEVYDVDHDGHIDHMTVFFNAPVDPNGAGVGNFVVGSLYTIAGFEGVNFDAGGVGIRNAGEYGVTVRLTEKTAYDTNVKPQLSYTGSGLIKATGDAYYAAAFGTSQAVEVDKARPVLISARTQDAGIGNGTASNGILDGIVFTFSEPVRNVTAGAALSSASSTSYIGLAIPVAYGLSFNQGNGTIASNVVTIPIGETAINTGVIPEITYNENYQYARITDLSSSATGAANINTYNSFYSHLDSYAPATNPTILTVDDAKMVVHSVETLDLGTYTALGAFVSGTPDGRLDHIRVTFSEDLNANASKNGVYFMSTTAAFASGASANGTYTPTAVTVSGPTATFTIGEVSTADVYDTEATPTFTYDKTADDSNIMDSAGNEIDSYGSGDLTAPDTIDTAAPVVVKIITGDAFADTTYAGESTFESDVPDGRIDSVTLVFSEKVQTGEGAANGGTALNHAISQFDVHHSLMGAGVYQTKFTTAATYGAPIWENAGTGDTKTSVTIRFYEVARATTGMVNGGDTGLGVTMLYTANGTASYNIKDYADDPNGFVNPGTWPTFTDGASPYVVSSILGETVSKENVLTYDVDADLLSTPARAAGNNGKGDGYLEGFVLNFTEPVFFRNPADNANIVGGTALGKFTTTAQNGGVLEFGKAAATVAISGSEVTLTGVRSTQGSPDTGTTPALTYTKDDDTLIIRDASGNKVAKFTDKPSYDDAPPVIVGVYGDTASANKLNFTFSEQVYAHNADGDNITVAAASITGNSLFGYENLSTGVGASGFTSAYVTQPSPNVLQATLNSTLTVNDIEADMVWLKSEKIFDDANTADASLLDNPAASSVSGASIKVWIMDDVIAPWITGIKTIDWNGNGKIDYLRVQFSEPMQDAITKGYVSNNAMSNDVSATWKISGYTGTARWNFFDKDNGQAAAIAAGKPVFSDNDTNDNVMYLELEEDAVPANALTGIGSTGFKPTVTWGTGANAETLGDFRPNLLDTASTHTAAPAATNGTVTDNVGPVIVGATASGTNLTLLFSEPVTTSDAIQTGDFTFVKNTATSTALESKIYGVSWTNNSTLALTLKSDFAWNTASSYGIQLTGTDGITWKDAAGVETNYFGTNLFLDASSLGAMYDEQSPISSAGQYPAKANVVGRFTISNLTYIADNGSSVNNVMVGTPVTLKWTYANVTNVDVFISYNNGMSYELVPGSRVAASAGTTTWTAKMGVTNVKVQSADNSGVNFSTAITVNFNGSVVGNSIGAPSNLTITDVPNDNGGFVYAKFAKSADHLTAVNSYQFYREVSLSDSTTAWVLWATVAAGIPDAEGNLTVILPTIWNDTSNWMVAASTGKLVSDGVVTAKVAPDAIPVAQVVYTTGAAKVVSSETVITSAWSSAVSGTAVDNIAPSALTSATAADNAGVGTGVLVSWVAPADHGIVASYLFNGVTNYVYGVDSYEVYRAVAGTTEYVLAGTVGSGSTSFTDVVADGATVYQYMVKALDSAHSVTTTIGTKVMAGNGTPDFNADGSISLGDLVLMGNVWGLKSTSPNFIANFDLNKDGEISLGDLVLLGNVWGTSTAKSAKLASEMPKSDIAMQMASSVSSDNSMYFVTINTQNASDIKGVSFELSYDASKFDFVPESVNGLGELQVVRANDGIISIASVYNSEKFNGTIALGFKIKSVNSVMNVAMVNAEVAINGVVSAANAAEGITLKAVPTTYTLGQNFPNPFNPTTTIEYSIPNNGHVSLVVYNVAGQKVRTLVNDTQSASFYKVVWDGKNDNGMTVGTGMYFYKLVSGNYSKIVKMTLMK